MQNVERVISVFNIEDENLCKEINVDHVSINFLQDIFKPQSDDYDMLDVYPISIEHALQLKKIIDIEFDFDNYIYQLDCYSK